MWIKLVKSKISCNIVYPCYSLYILLSSHKLRIETDRYSRNRMDRVQRKCLIPLNCNLNDLEDEYHFVLICPMYNDLRTTYIKKYYFRRPSLYTCVELFKSTNKPTVKNLSKYVYEAFKFRLTNTVDINV